jgi:hypothetical protein
MPLVYSKVKLVISILRLIFRNAAWSGEVANSC